MAQGVSRKRSSGSQSAPTRRSKFELEAMLDYFENKVIDNDFCCTYCGKEIMRRDVRGKYTFKVTRATVISHADQKCAYHKRAVHKTVEDTREVQKPSAEETHLSSSVKEDTTKALDEFVMHQDEILEFQEELREYEYTEPWYDIAGAQYEGREYRLSMCDDEELVILQKEPDNPHDSDAVRLYPSDSYPKSYDDLGFIPADQNYAFQWSPSPIAFGRIRRTDGEENYCRGWKRKRWAKQLGREVYLLRKPCAPTICPMPIPGHLMDTCRKLVQRLDRGNSLEWVRYKTGLLDEEEEHTCVYSGLACDTLEPIFSFLTRSKIVRIDGFRLVHRCLRHLLYIDHATSSDKSTVERMSRRISLLNPDIEIDEAETVYRRIVKESLDRTGWRIDPGEFKFAASYCV